MVEHSASVTIKAPVHQVYQLFTHFNDFPKFMSFVKEVSYKSEQVTHWVVQVGRQYEWDAVNEDWVPDQQIGWRSINGLRNGGKVKFRALGAERTSVDVYIQYTPPSGPLGKLGDLLGVSTYFETVLQKDLNHFARMVEQAPSDALDPMSSHYLFHEESAVARKLVTSRQLEEWQRDPRMSPQALAERQARIQRETEMRLQEEKARQEALRLKAEQEQRALEEQRSMLAREAVRRRQEELMREASRQSLGEIPLDPRHVYAAWANGLGDKDGSRARIPNFTQDPMTARIPTRPLSTDASALPPAE